MLKLSLSSFHVLVLLFTILSLLSTVILTDQQDDKEHFVSTFHSILHENIILPQHEMIIKSRLRNSDWKSSIAFYATGRAGCGKTKTLSCIEKAFSKVKFGECSPSTKCHLQINGYMYRNDTVSFIEKEISRRINEFINIQYEKCEKLFILVEYAQWIHFPLLSVVNPFLSDEQVEGISDTVLLGNIFFLIAGNKGYSSSIHPELSKRNVRVTNEHFEEYVLPEESIGKLSFNEIDEKMMNSSLYVNELDPSVRADKKILELKETERKRYINSATQFIKSNKVAFLVFNQQDLRKVIKMKVEELTYTLKTDYQVEVVWQISEVTKYVHGHISGKDNIENLRKDGGRAVTEYLQQWLRDYEKYMQDYPIVTTYMMTNAHFPKQPINNMKKILQMEKFECEGDSMNLLLKQLLYFNISVEKFVKLVRTKLGKLDKYYCNTRILGANSVYIINGYYWPYNSNYELENIDKFIENENEIKKITQNRTCKPWDTNNFVGLTKMDDN